ncbi:MAG: HEAT repeat domain-containing protein [Planctomycetes bacterium]|nr:HEAT repeat domain-containing protein [Planctomycetota bacterium]
MEELLSRLLGGFFRLLGRALEAAAAALGRAASNVATYALNRARRLLQGRAWRRRVAAAWEETAGRLGLGVLPDDSRLGTKIAGEREGCRVEIRLVPAELAGTATCIEVADGGLPAEPSIGAESDDDTGGGGGLGRLDLQVGDGDFDRAVRLKGPDLALVAALDEATRDRVLHLVTAGRGRLQAGHLSFHLPGVVTEIRPLRRVVRELTHIAARLAARPDQLPAMLVDNAICDPYYGVRVRNLGLLLQHLPQSAEARSACAAVLKHEENPELLVRAAAHLGAQGRRLLEERLRAARTADALRADVLRRAIATAPPADAIALLESVLGLGRAGDDVRRQAFLALLRLGRRFDFPALLALRRGAQPELAVEIVKELRALGDPRVEPLLISLLREKDLRVVAVVIAALGQIGSVAAVEPLLGWANASWLVEGGVRESARAAIAAIQARAGNVGAGRLSLVAAAPEAGALTLASAGGELTLLAGKAAAPGAAAEAGAAAAEVADGPAAQGPAASTPRGKTVPDGGRPTPRVRP